MRLLLPTALAFLGPLVALNAPPVAPQALAAPNYTQNVAPLLRTRCVGCHRTDGSAPFSLSSYGQAKRWSTMNLQVVGSRRMPPWKPSEQGVFHGENRLSEEEIGLLKAWDKAGSPEGPSGAVSLAVAAPAALPAGAADKLLQPARPYVVAGGAEEEYRYFVLRNPYSETKWLRGIDLKPGNPRVVHHITAFLDSSDCAARMAAANTDGQAGYSAKHGGRFRPSSVLGFWAPGMENRPMPEGTAMELPPKTNIVVQVHYVSTGKAETDRWSLGLRLADGPPKRAMTTGMIERVKLDIPAGTAAYEAIKEETLPADVTLWALMPHAHGLARRMAAEAILPDGKRRPLVSIADWDPAWQSMYWFKDAVHLPKGTHIRFAVTYDNSDANLRNPNSPPRDTHWGEGSHDEMMLLAFLFTRD